MNQFNNFQELWRFLNSKPVEPKKYVEQAEEEKPKKATKKRKKDGEVLQAD